MSAPVDFFPYLCRGYIVNSHACTFDGLFLKSSIKRQELQPTIIYRMNEDSVRYLYLATQT